MGKKILLARPHPMIATTMAPFLQENGFEISKIETFDEIKTKAMQSDAVVNSQALNSTIKQTASNVCKEIRRHNPNIPVVFFALFEFEKARPNFNVVAAESGEKNVFIKINQDNMNAPFFRKKNAFVYISRNDLGDKTQREMSSKIISSYFKK